MTVAHPHPADPALHHVNLRGAAFMVLAMAFFAVEDALIKALAATVPTPQIVLLLGLCGGTIFAVFALLKEGPARRHLVLHPAVLARTGFEAVGTIAFTTALALVPLATASAILQAVPLVVTLGAALFLGETIGWRRWTAVLVGFLGVLIILRPGLEGFSPAALFAVLATVMLAARDIATRRMPEQVGNAQISALAFLTLVPTGAATMAVTGTAYVRLDMGDWALMAVTLLLGLGAYVSIIAATRRGSTSVIAPFRYSRILFALVIAVLFFGERPDGFVLFGCALIVATGLYAVWRERRVAAAAASPLAPRKL